MKKLKMKEGFDVGLEMSGNEKALQSMISSLNNGAKIALLGLFSKNVELDLNSMIFKGLQIKGIYGREMYETWYKMTAMIQSGLNLKNVITHRFPWKDFEKGFELLNSGKCAKAILTW
jgi:threonine 3-dehydrogenase